MLGRIRFHDYRCFYREEPATLEVRAGLTSFIGTNNAGKSALIKSIYEIRNILEQLRILLDYSGQNLSGPLNWQIPAPLLEHDEIVSDRNEPFCRVEIEPHHAIKQSLPSVARLILDFKPKNKSFAISMLSSEDEKINTPISHPASFPLIGYRAVIGDKGKIFHAEELYQFIQLLTDVQYFGPFRNAINEGAGKHFDSLIGTGFINQWHEWKTGA